MIKIGSTKDALVSRFVHLVSFENHFKDLIQSSQSILQTIDFKFIN